MKCKILVIEAESVELAIKALEASGILASEPKAVAAISDGKIEKFGKHPKFKAVLKTKKKGDSPLQG